MYQLNKYMVTELKSDNNYSLKFSDKNANAPVYDLKYFSDKIPEKLQIVKTTIPIKIGKDEIVKEKNVNLENYWLWASIIAIALLLGYMSYKMINDKKKQA